MSIVENKRGWKAAVLAGVLALASTAASHASTVFINEFHYDNTGGDQGEFVEVAGAAGTDLNGWEVLAYNGSNGRVYATYQLSGVLADQSNGYGFFTVSTPGLQNGAPDGLALVNSMGSVLQFLSYEGAFSATDGAAAGLTSTNIGVSQNEGTPPGQSLQLLGTGTMLSDFIWAAGLIETPGSVNLLQNFTGSPAPVPVPHAALLMVTGIAGLCSRRSRAKA